MTAAGYVEADDDYSEYYYRKQRQRNEQSDH